MESPSTRYIPQKSKKRVFPGGGGVGNSSSCIDPDVIEISPPMPPTHRSSSNSARKLKGVMPPEIIDVDMDEDCGDNIMLIDGEVVDWKSKGKGVMVNDSKVPGSAAKDGSMVGVQSSKKTSAPALPNFIDLDGSNGDACHFVEDDYMDMYLDDYVYDDDYAILQSHFDNIDLPTGVEAPIPWFQGHAQFGNYPTLGNGSASSSSKNLLGNAVPAPVLGSSHSIWTPVPGELSKNLSSSSSGSQFQLSSSSHAHGADQSPFSSWSSAKQANRKKMPAGFTGSNFLSPQVEKGAVNVSADMSFEAWRQSISFPYEKKHSFPEGASNQNKPGGMMPPSAAQPFKYPHKTKYQVGNGSFFPNLPGPMEPFHGGDASISKLKRSAPKKKKQLFMTPPSYSGFYDPFDNVHGFIDKDMYTLGIQDIASTQNKSTDTPPGPPPSSSDILAKYKLFKQFDTVEDHSDHHFTRNGASSKQPAKNWSKKIQDEWKILEKDLPDTIFVRVYESRMDLMRAVIIGAEGTPYHDGLFFFDIFFPSSYPNVPPHVHYHSGGLRINPNLYNCGKVCLSLLNTWSGGQKEKWIPGMSTMLQVLVSIQGLILNAKPYFNEPGFAHSSGSPEGERSALQYNENTLILSLKTMLYTVRRPPKHFEDLVVGHFCKYGHDILVACKAYIEGAQVGCLVRGGVQDVDEGGKSSSPIFKDSIAGLISALVQAFTQAGAKDTEKFLPLAQTRMPPALTNMYGPNMYGPW